MTPLRPLSRRERLDWLRLARSPGVGPLTFSRLLSRCHSADAALEALPDLSRGRLRAAPMAACEQELEQLEALRARLLCSCEPDYPTLLAQLEPPPPVLAVRGDVRAWRRPCVALVGAREASAAGLRLAEDFARDLGAAGFVVVSGLARGVDAACHRASLATGTIAVLAGGLAHPYPPQNSALHDAIVERGAVVSEAPLQAVARGRDFPRRNHVISGLSLGVVVVEAALRSGSLITARAALEQGREVMAAPASPLDPRGRGGNALIKQGAALVENAEDILAHLQAFPRPAQSAAAPAQWLFPAFEPAPDLAGRLQALLSPTPVHLNEMARLLGAPVSSVAAAFVELELAGLAASLPGGFITTSAAGFQSAG